MVADKGARVLVVDDEQEILRLLKVTLSANGYDFISASTGEEGIEKAAHARPDIIILDIGLPDMSGIDVVRSLREWSHTPIVILSVHGQEQEKVEALDAGADDYITKPFYTGELLARLRVVQRHAVKQAEPLVDLGELQIDLSLRRVTVRGNVVRLTPTEYDVLKVLAVNAGKIVTHKQLLSEVWGLEGYRDNQYPRVYVAQLRKKLELDPSRPSYILTEPGVGYRLSHP